MAVITVKDWYQLDFSIGYPKNTLLKIAEMMQELKSKGQIDLWFFLFEGHTIRVRMRSYKREGLKQSIEELAKIRELSLSDNLPFSEYQEGEEALFNEMFVESFAKIMSELTGQVIAKLKGETSFANYGALERLQHCMFNVVMGLNPFIGQGSKSEEYFLLQRLNQRVGGPFDSDFG